MHRSGPLLFVLLLLGLAALLLAAPWQNVAYDRSAVGSKGLETWLQSNGIAVSRSGSHVSQARSELSFRILPLRPPLTNAGTDDASDTGTPIEAETIEEKLHELPTLIVLPKWRDAIVKEGIARGSMLASADGIYRMLDDLYIPELRIRRIGPVFTETSLSLAQEPPAKVSLYRAQLFDRPGVPEFCKELAGFSSGALLLQCEDGITFYLLSDPDILNNHGLALAENANFALSLIRNLRGLEDTRPIYLDTDSRLLDEEKPVDEGRTYERSISDVERLFDYPLTAIWVSILLVTAICFWRGAYRFGPPLDEAAGQSSGNVEISKTAAVDAMARLLRISGNDGRMVAQFVQHLLMDAAVRVFGSGAGNQAGVERLFQRLSRRDEARASELRSVSQTLIEHGPTMQPSELHHNLETFRQLMRSTDLGSG
ncbi:hypothetical protein [Pseudochelatococcus contaminans]|uniref:DUF4350 domain-containing protein n=1 Tax=Pseudochelatococcus contaminans TaxID=1538103 RepID=A0A7W5Z4P3_9HYPH|nr:hypothetical protein [Pseudochelatococcus contaminans]MBB3810131.1 hypothetical protein [Pseudochelatococcus contaminans]